MVDAPRAPIFGRLKGYAPSDLSAQDQVTGVPAQLFPPPPGQIQLAPQPRIKPSNPAWLAPFFPGLIQSLSTDAPRAPNSTRYRDYDRRVGIYAQAWVWQVPANIPAAPSTDIPRAPHLATYRPYDRRVGVNAQAWVWQNLTPFTPGVLPPGAVLLAPIGRPRRADAWIQTNPSVVVRQRRPVLFVVT